VELTDQPTEDARTRVEPPERPERIQSDGLYSRRESLRMLGYLSGALVVGSTAVGAGLFRRHGAGESTETLVASSLEPGEAVTFSYPGDHDPAIAVRLRDGSLVAYSSVCTHLGCAVLWSRERGALECPCHKGAFSAQTGRPVAGPPERPLPRIRLEQRTNGIYAHGRVE
jgi:nitrite reductase/ring-hydroxylating ferredoxin subunit